MGWHIISLLVSSAFAYPTPVDFDGSLMRWDISRDSAPITYEVVSDSDIFIGSYGDAIIDATALWSEIPTSYFRYAPVAAGQKAQVTLNLSARIDGGNYSAGYAIFDEYAGKKPKHCSIFVVIDQYVTYQGMQKTILHELGHCLGLGHSLIPEAIMSYRLEENSYALDIDDKAAASRLYPADGSKPHLPPGCAVGVLRGDSSSWLPLLLFMMPLWPAVARRYGGRVRRQELNEAHVGRREAQWRNSPLTVTAQAYPP